MKKEKNASLKEIREYFKRDGGLKELTVEVFESPTDFEVFKKSISYWEKTNVS